MAAPLGFKTFTTGEVLTAADTNGYLMQGVLVFDDAAARSAAITSPQEGQSSYLKDTDVIQVYSGSAWVTKSGAASPLTTKGDLYTYSTTDARLAVGTNGQALIADSTAATGMKWDTPAAGGMTLISTTTLSGASITLSSIPQTYLNLYLVIRNYLPSIDSEDIRLRVNGDAGARYATTSGTFSGTFWSLASSNDNAVTQSYAQMNIWDYTNTTTWKSASTIAFGNNATTPTNVGVTSNPTQIHNQTIAITSLLLYPGAGNFTSGTALLYGVK